MYYEQILFILQMRSASARLLRQRRIEFIRDFVYSKRIASVFAEFRLVVKHGCWNYVGDGFLLQHFMQIQSFNFDSNISWFIAHKSSFKATNFADNKRFNIRNSIEFIARGDCNQLTCDFNIWCRSPSFNLRFNQFCINKANWYHSSCGNVTPICLRISSAMRRNSRLSLCGIDELSVLPARIHFRTSSASYRNPQLLVKLKTCLASGNGQLFSVPSISISEVDDQKFGTWKLSARDKLHHFITISTTFKTSSWKKCVTRQINI